jgi:hypothetical protein
MKRWLAAGTLALASALGALEAQDAEAPFYRKYLVAGNALDDAIVEIEKRIEEQPGDANLHNDLGNLLALRGFPEQAGEQYEQAAKLDKSNFIALYNLGLLRETEGRTSDAISAYKKSIARKPGFPPSRFRLGRLYEQGGQIDDAVIQYARAFWIDPSMRDPKRNPLVIDSELMYRASLAIYERDVARATLDRDAAFHEEPAFRQIPVDRSVDSGELTETEPEPAPREVGPGSGVPAGPGTVRRPRPTPGPETPRQRAPGSRAPRTPRPAPAVTPAPPPPEEPTEMMPPENVPPPEGEPTPAPPEEEVEPS